MVSYRDRNKKERRVDVAGGLRFTTLCTPRETSTQLTSGGRGGRGGREGSRDFTVQGKEKMRSLRRQRTGHAQYRFVDK
ncbi:unnamed protein product [Arctogadus glacialis]